MPSIEFEVPLTTYSRRVIAALFPHGTKVSIKSNGVAKYVIVSTSQQYSQQGLGELYHKICSAQKPEHRTHSDQTHRVQHGQHRGQRGQHVQHGQHNGGHVQHGQHRGGHVQHGHHNGGHAQSAKHQEYVGPGESVHKGKSSVQTPRQGPMLTQGAWGCPRSNNGT